MNLMRFADKQTEENYCVAWLPDGKSFVIRNPEEFTRKVLPHYFKATKFSSFTRKLYRWGFRQVNRGIGPDDPIIFGNEFFQRDNAELMAKMRSITAASTRKAEQASATVLYGQKRPMEGFEMDARDPKRMLLDQLIQNKAASFQGHSIYGSSHGALNLSNALRPSLGGNAIAMAHSGFKPYDMLGQSMCHTNPLLSSFQLQHQTSVGGSLQNSGRVSQYPSAASTAEIVNAAINALRFAS